MESDNALHLLEITLYKNNHFEGEGEEMVRQFITAMVYFILGILALCCVLSGIPETDSVISLNLNIWEIFYVTI